MCPLSLRLEESGPLPEGRVCRRNSGDADAEMEPERIKVKHPSRDYLASYVDSVSVSLPSSCQLLPLKVR